MYNFLVCFYVLDYCFWSHSDRDGMMNRDDLGGLLGVMNPDMLADGRPMDEAVLTDWNRILLKTPNSDFEWIDAVDRFLDYYEKNFGFDFLLARPMLKNKKVLDYVQTAKEKARKACDLHNY